MMDHVQLQVDTYAPAVEVVLKRLALSILIAMDLLNQLLIVPKQTTTLFMYRWHRKMVDRIAGALTIYELAVQHQLLEVLLQAVDIQHQCQLTSGLQLQIDGHMLIPHFQLLGHTAL